jgi:hypothetical protein
MTPAEAVTVLGRSVFYGSRGAHENDREAIAVLQSYLNVPIDEVWGNGFAIRGGFLYENGEVRGAISSV